MSVLPRDTSKKVTVTCCQARKNLILAKEIVTSQGPLKPKRKTLENSVKNSQYSETSSNLDQTDLLDISIGRISDSEINTANKSIIEFDDTVGDITFREKSIFENITANSTFYDRTLCPDQSSNISNNEIFTPFQKGYEFIDPFATKSQLNRTPESQQVQENLPYKINQITLNDSANIEQALDSLKFSHPYSTFRKSDEEISANNSPSKTAINNLPNNNLPIQSTEMMNLSTNQQVSLRNALEILPYFDGSSKVSLTEEWTFKRA